MLARAALVVLVMLAACGDSGTDSNEPPFVPEDASEALFVQAGASGDGDWRTPLGSVQAALDQAELDSTIKLVYVAVGEYHESVVVSSAIKLIGGRDPQNEWLPTDVDSTVIRGRRIEGQPVTVMVRGVPDLVVLQNLSIYAPDAKGPGESPVAVFCLGSAQVELKSNHIVGGVPGDGGDGAPGTAGEDGFGLGDTQGYLGAPGGAGGAGGTAAQEPEWGASGLCSDGSATGGNGGAPGEDPLAGQPGPGGDDGAAGIGGRTELSIDSSGTVPRIHVLAGGDGGDGADGCGGGGGGGHAMCSPDVPGGAGGHGGSGGQGGAGGGGGQAGGCSIGVMVYRSLVRLQDCLIEVQPGGDGGDGATGAIGGLGGDGFVGESIAGCSGGNGGRGGDRGQGGHGGGGAGGWSVGVVVYDANELEQDNAVYRLSLGGQPGRGPGAGGETGFSQRTAVIR
ncbi:hypothetical protein GF356_04120 [candidate division GN15 bacterium]|nr:hypothetical protein [candidate division GN15 bacterium]